MKTVIIRKRKYETPDIASIQLTTENSLLTGSVITVTEVPITILEEGGVTIEDYQPFDSGEDFKELNF